jgi:hypothetical protein
MDSNYHGQGWIMRFLWKEHIKPSDIFFLVTCNHGEKVPACSTVFNWIGSFNGNKGIAHESVHEWYHSTPNE